MQKKWWHDMIAYQIYPKSFQDSNGDGIGDLVGIIKRLDYIQELGINTIWISPIYQSPMKDQGYDISDYYKIDPQFGTMQDMEELLAQCSRRKIKVLMDLVVNHCSSEHEWFRKALKEPLGPYGRYFIIREGIRHPDSSCILPPNNWRSIFGGSVWEPIAGTNLYYYHTFVKEQPDLNWENASLRNDIYEMMNYWLKKGLGGFRVDAITYIKKDLSFRSLEPDGADGLASIREVSENYPGIEVFLREMRDKTFRRYDAFSVAEMAGVSDQMLKTYIGEDGIFSSIFDFSYINLDVEEELWYRKREVHARDIKQIMYPMHAMAEQVNGRLSTVLENHDQPRSLNKWIRKEDIGYESAAMLATWNLTLRGIPFIYQGEEIGMTNFTASDINEFDDVATHGQYQRALLEGETAEEALQMANARSRDHSRTPMQWDGSVNAGFTKGTPWLPANENYREINVECQLLGERSLLQYYRKLTALRNHKDYGEVFVHGTIIPLLEEQEQVIGYQRCYQGKSIYILLNFSGEAITITLPKRIGKCLISNYERRSAAETILEMKAYEAVVFE